MGVNTLGRWICRMVVVAAVGAGAPLGAALVADVEPDLLRTVAEAAADTDDQGASPAAHEWQ